MLYHVTSRALQTCEDLEDGENLRHLFHIMRGVIMLNDTSLLEALMAEDAVMVRPEPSPFCLVAVCFAANAQPQPHCTYHQILAGISSASAIAQGYV